MAVKSPLARNLLGFLGAFALRGWRATMDWRAAYVDGTADPVHPRFARLGVYICWHEVVLTPLAMRASRNNVGLASEHGDAEIISRAIQHLGWSVVRGSTTRGGTTALMKMLRRNTHNLCLTPDGPRGPRRTMSVGPIFLASRLGIPIVCFGCGYDRPWRMRSWDRFAVPRPYSRARVLFGPALSVPAGLDRHGIENYRVWFESLLNWLTEEAERWAESGRRRRGEVPMIPGRATSLLAQWRPADALQLPDWLHENWQRLGNEPITTESTSGGWTRAA